MAESFTELDEQYLLCRDLGHAWAPYDVEVLRRPRQIRRILKCRDCGAKRTQTLDADYAIEGNSYQYPEGYSVKGHPMTKAARAEVRSLTTQNWRRRKQ